ncbi:MAG: phage Gp37/Gp68 family protein [Deltaproteobacteria bacterium]|nr:phage Gp37/Gp68 family protein [Deltaproteobacteria bacterium]
MISKTNIEWADGSWTNITGCTQISEACDKCYAKPLTERLQRMGISKYAAGFHNVVSHERCLNEPLKWQDPKRIFVNSMSDTFHSKVSVEFIRKIFNITQRAPHHTYMMLTKRSQRLVELAKKLPWHDNIWLGVTVESAKYTDRIDDLRQVPAKVRFLSVEPMLSPLPQLNLDGINWVICGGQSGPGSKPLNPLWAMDLRDQCVARNIPFFFKQYGGPHNKKLGCVLDGKVWNQYPDMD